ncbi:MAG: molybdopterin-synthase adenylyltransferase MoeB [Gammaproteobacteria bacterium]|jgi:adenylyltransferase/sulfurtransferase|nr:molybdopterin-synthase adenylyltransferase MoeB [Gammaproteobacteria bacterium]MCH2577609.1 molybdopterin-synthase adenylyltransferase MoeB [Pseudomonadales bacterium]MEC8950382.1 molybdopterin-synthase adenylyltransferase MoeB [Pseudomonadota bacterium]MBI90923.1 molybdopterin-synthase adenylyltransferase MoeB [Gammaproteobacteria bacterium]MEC8995498.1 molybdopterin-synthase adenylyltransferase MoeB [Pseudomonadota bacterium]|tara:strand:+ start:16 stop:774 length:759 start_codon:yes stop_codon:yes gene_type:complete
MKDEQLLRFSRQIMLPEMDVAGQQKLVDATVLIVGMGGLGCPAAMYLAAAGVGHLIIADDDTVELTNLQRQIAHEHRNLGESKVSSAKASLRGLNPDVCVTQIDKRLEGESLNQAVSGADVVVDASDNFATRFAINRSCLKNHKPLVSGAAIRMEGQVAVFDSGNPESPCYRCLYNENTEDDANCSQNGVMAPLVGIIGSVQAMETIKVITGIGNNLTGRLLLLDATTMQWREMKLPCDPNCPACSGVGESS